MKRLLLILLFSPLLGFAKSDPISFDFVGVPLVTFGQATFKSIMHRDFVITPEVLTLDRKITISVKNIDATDVPRFVENILLQQGIATTLKDGVYYLAPVKNYQELPAATETHKTAVAATATDAAIKQVTSTDAFSSPSETDTLSQQRKSDDDSFAYRPINRSSEFLVSVINAAFGKQSAILAGSQIVITGSKPNLTKIRNLIESLDILPKKVDISASWIEVTQNSGTGRGISLIASVLGSKLSASLGTINSGSAISLKNTNFELVIDALNSDVRFNQVSNSRIVGNEYEKLNLTVGDETPTISSTGKDNAGNPVQNVTYRPSGVIIDVLPRVLGSGNIEMMIDGQISSFKATMTGVSGSPTLIKRQVKTSVTVGDGEVLLIGGLNDSQNTNSNNGLAFLPQSWTLNSGSKVQTDLVLVLSAQIHK